MLDAFFCDDARQDNPSRDGIGHLVAAGGLHVPAEHVRDLEDDLEAICQSFGFPSDPSGEFKWSPGRDLWMRSNLLADRRRDFQLRVIGAARDSGVSATIIVEDRNYRTATGVAQHEEDVVALLLERINSQLNAARRAGIVVVDRPSGSRTNEDAFLQQCLETISTGTRYVRPDRIAVNVLSTPSRLIRCLQLADLVTSCSLAFISGENTYAPPLFEAIRPLLNRERGRIGGVGVKIHPDFIYVNLYHWLLGDYDAVRGNGGTPLPLANRPYATSPDRL